MKVLTLKNYEDEILRLTNILINEKCNENDDKILKNLLDENLENYELIKINSPRKKSGFKQLHINTIISNLKTLVYQSFGSKDDIEIKSKVKKELVLLAGGHVYG